jgi:cbb3-type cytochrome oxidase cytochrome c subunit
MRHGPVVFLGLLGALVASWFGMIAVPQLQLGGMQPVPVPPANELYPAADSGLAALGREVYRANGCAYCHTQVVRQDGFMFDVVLTDAGTNQADVVKAVAALRRDLPPAEAAQLVERVPGVILRTPAREVADAAHQNLTGEGAEITVRVLPTGPDIARGWGSRMTVGQDYLYERPLMLGSVRIGQDLANVGLRRPDENWHLLHLYDPKISTPGSIMPKYPFLFERRRRGAIPSPDALHASGDYEIFPKPEARALVAYLLSLRADAPLFQAPAPQVAPASAAQNAKTTNQALTNEVAR